MAKVPVLRTTPMYAGVVREMDEMQNRLRRFFNEGLPEPFMPTEPLGWFPTVEIVEDKDELVLKAELPGLTRDDVEVLFEDDALVLRGEKKEEKVENDDRRFHLWERTYGAFRRVFILPQAIDQAKVVAEFKDGILTVRMPKAEQAKIKGRKIEIQKK